MARGLVPFGLLVIVSAGVGSEGRDRGYGMLLTGAACMNGPAQGVRTPWPTVDFDRGQLPGLESFFAAPEPDQWRAFLHRTSFAVLRAPQLRWILLQQRAASELWTSAGFESRWSLAVQDWERTLIIHLVLHASELGDAYAGGSGNVTRFLLKTATGYREEIPGGDLPSSLPQFVSTPPRYENSYWLYFDRPAALAPGTEWIRLYVMTTDGRMYFEWRF